MQNQDYHNCFSILEKISRTTSSLEKMELLMSLRGDKFTEFYFETIFNPYLTYGVRTINKLENQYPIPSFKEIQLLRQKLVSRELSGLIAQREVDIFCNTILSFFNKWFSKMWGRDLKIGISTITINKVFKNLIPTFNIQLCNKYNSEERLVGDWLIQPKYDGLRCLFFFEKGVCKGILSRSGKELFNLEHISKELLNYIKHCDCVLDGEICGKNWNDTISMTKSSVTEIKNKDIVFYIFDFISLEDWNKKICNYSLKQRLHQLNSLFCKDGNYFKIIPIKKILTKGDIIHYAKIWLDVGYEGAVLKEENSFYEFKRSNNWLKVKFEETEDLEIIGFKEGTGRNMGKLGAFLCQFNNIEVDVGGGFSDKQRESFWWLRNDLIGRIIEVKFQEKTKDGSMRFPVFLRFRDDKINFRG